MPTRMSGDQDPTVRKLDELMLTRVFDAPRERVWQAWTQPHALAKWWGPHSFTNPTCQLDVRPGGAIRIDMRGPDGTVHPVAGTFQEVTPLDRLVFTSSALDGNGRPLFEVLNTVTFTEQNGRTTIVLHWRVIKATAAAARLIKGSEAGWTQSLDRLAIHLDRAAKAAEAESETASSTTFTFRSEDEIVARRAFPAPCWLVFLAWTSPEHFARWWGPRGFTNTVCEMDVRPGGAWRVVQRAPDGTEHPFRGVYREVVPPERLVFTQAYDVAPWTGREVLVTATFDEQHGQTVLTIATRFASVADRDGMLQNGMKRGLLQALDRLALDLGSAVFGPGTPWEREIVAVRVFGAPRDLLWRMWTDPTHVAKWWGPRGFTTTIHQMDVEPGGIWRFVMHGPDGVDYDNEMVFTEVEKPERLVYSHIVPPPFRQEVTFTELGVAKTRITVRSTFESAADVQPYAIKGMHETLERFEAMVTSALAVQEKA